MLQDLFLHTDLLNKALLTLFTLSFFVQLYFYLVIFRKACYKPQPQEEGSTTHLPISVIICAKNEATNLQNYLPTVLNQDYPDYEVIVVNDCSEDETEDILQEFVQKYPRLKVSTIKKDPIFSHGKKLALTIGIKAASNNHLLLTDADCVPTGPEWIKLMTRNFTGEKELIIGVGLYKKRKGLLNLIIRAETVYIAMQYIAMARHGRPYMGVGRNLAYTKELFFRNKGFASHTGLKSGDDDLFIKDAATKANTGVENHPDSITWSDPKESVRDWAEQKRRHLLTGKFYQQSIKYFLASEYISRILLNTCFILLLIRYENSFIILSAYIILLIIKAIIFFISFRNLHEKLLLLPSLLIEPFLPLFYGLLHILNFLDRKNRWI